MSDIMWVGPVLMRSEVGEAMAAAIADMQPGVEVIDRGSYLRVRAPNRCALDRIRLEARLLRRVEFPGELEAVMTSFAGRLEIDDDQAVWSR